MENSLRTQVKNARDTVGENFSIQVKLGETLVVGNEAGQKWDWKDLKDRTICDFGLLIFCCPEKSGGSDGWGGGGGGGEMPDFVETKNSFWNANKKWFFLFWSSLGRMRVTPAPDTPEDSSTREETIDDGWDIVIAFLLVELIFWYWEYQEGR